MVNWDMERAVWGRAFSNVVSVEPRSCGLVLTEPPFNLPSIQDTQLQASLCKRPERIMTLRALVR